MNQVNANSELPEQTQIDKENIDLTKVSVAEQPKVETPAEESKEERNWRRFRQEREKERKALEEANRKREEAERQAAVLKSAFEAMTKSQPIASVPTEAAQYPSYEDETEEQRVNRLVQKAIQDAEKRRIEEARRREAQELPEKLAQTYPAFNEVCSDENLDYLQFHYPEIYHAFKMAPDSFDKWGNVYKAIKRFVPNTDTKKEEKKIEQNMRKPQSMNVPGVASTSESIPYRVDEKRRMENWARMQKLMKGQ